MPSRTLARARTYMVDSMEQAPEKLVRSVCKLSWNVYKNLRRRIPPERWASLLGDDLVRVTYMCIRHYEVHEDEQGLLGLENLMLEVQSEDDIPSDDGPHIQTRLFDVLAIIEAEGETVSEAFDRFPLAVWPWRTSEDEPSPSGTPSLSNSPSSSDSSSSNPSTQLSLESASSFAQSEPPPSPPNSSSSNTSTSSRFRETLQSISEDRPDSGDDKVDIDREDGQIISTAARSSSSSYKVVDQSRHGRFYNDSRGTMTRSHGTAFNLRPGDPIPKLPEGDFSVVDSSSHNTFYNGGGGTMGMHHGISYGTLLPLPLRPVFIKRTLEETSSRLSQSFTSTQRRLQESRERVQKSARRDRDVDDDGRGSGSKEYDERRYEGAERAIAEAERTVSDAYRQAMRSTGMSLEELGIGPQGNMGEAKEVRTEVFQMVSETLRPSAKEEEKDLDGEYAHAQRMLKLAEERMEEARARMEKESKRVEEERRVEEEKAREEDRRAKEEDRRDREEDKRERKEDRRERKEERIVEEQVEMTSEERKCTGTDDDDDDDRMTTGAEKANAEAFVDAMEGFMNSLNDKKKKKKRFGFGRTSAVSEPSGERQTPRGLSQWFRGLWGVPN